MSEIQDFYDEYSCIGKYHFDKEKTSRLQQDLKNIKSEELVGKEDHRLYLKLLKTFREIIKEFDDFHGKNFKTTIMNILSVGTDGIYSSELHFLEELIQNVDDCDYYDPTQAKLNIHCDFNDGKMTFEYNEKGFSPFDVFAITGIAEASKNIDSNKVQIGEKGLGFKSVFGVADAVLVQSGYFSFRLDKEDFTCPIPCYDCFEYIKGTKLTLYMSAKTVEGVFRSFTNRYKSDNSLLNNNPLLFLNKLSELRVYYDGWRSLKFTVDRKFDLSKIDKLEKAGGVRLTYEDGKDASKEIICTQYVMPITFDKQACVSRYGKDTTFGQKKMFMQILFPEVEAVRNGDIKNGAFYSFLPTKIKSSVPMVCHVPFKLNSSREYIDFQDNNLWFKQCCERFSAMINGVFLDMAHTLKENVIYYLPKKSEYLLNSDKDYAVL